MQPKFSIITVTYNAERFLKQTILSVLSQSYPNIEYIIIDGNSTDGTREIIEQFAAGLAYWSSEPDKGLYDAMNKGLQHATGDYVWFINAGDTLYSSDLVQHLAQNISRKKRMPDVIYGETMIVDEAGNTIGPRRLRAPRALSWGSFRSGMRVCHQSFIAKRSIVPMYDTQYRLVADYEWCIRCLKQSNFIYNSRLILSNFMEGGISEERRKESLKERYRVMCRYYGTFPTMLFHIWFAIRFYYSKWFLKRV